MRTQANIPIEVVRAMMNLQSNPPAAMPQLDEAALLGVVEAAAAGGDKDAAAWLGGEGRVAYCLRTCDVRFIRFTNQSERFSQKAVEFTRGIFARDGFKCTECGAKGKLQAHHIKEWAEFPELRFDKSNVVTLCVECHCKKHPGMEALIRKARYKKPRGVKNVAVA